jgi:hypothetical protein
VTVSLWKLVMLAGVVGGVAACSGDLSETGAPPLAPSAPLAEENGRVSAQSMPNAVFHSVPGPDGDGAIRGNNPLLVQFNNCQSRPTNEDDDLKFTYDFDNDGNVDAFGHCRWEHTFTGPADARVCVSDRRGNDVCRTWEVRPSPGRGGDSARVSSITFTVDYIPDGGLAFPFEFYLNGRLLGTGSTSGVPFQCPAPALTFTVTDPAWIDGSANTLRFLKTQPRGTNVWPAIGWVHVEVKRTDGTSQGACLYDADGGGQCMAGGPNSCLFPPNNWNPVDVSTTMTF